MSEIRVGMMVEIVDDGTPEVGPLDRTYFGHMGEVVGFFDVDPAFGRRWEVDGANPAGQAWPESMLRPINDDDQASWDNEVWQKIGWNPTKQGEPA